MGDLFYRPEQAWVGDLIPYYEDGIYYGFYLHDPRIRDREFAEETTWHLVTTKDFVKLTYKGEVIRKQTRMRIRVRLLSAERMACITFFIQHLTKILKYGVRQYSL